MSVKCVSCRHNADCAKVSHLDDCTEYNPATNADRIRAMSDEELADFINDTEYGFIDRPGMCDVCTEHRLQTCYQCWLDWLREEADNGT